MHPSGMVLAVRRTANLWSLPFGEVNPNESVLDCALRVTLEQTGVTCSNWRPTDPAHFERYGYHTVWLAPKWGWHLDSVISDKEGLMDVYIPDTFPKLTSSKGEKAGWVKPWVLADRARYERTYLMDMFTHFGIDWTEGL